MRNGGIRYSSRNLESNNIFYRQYSTKYYSYIFGGVLLYYCGNYYLCTLKELFDSIATQNAEIRTVAKSLPLFLKYSAKSLFFNRLSQTDKNLK